MNSLIIQETKDFCDWLCYRCDKEQMYLLINSLTVKPEYKEIYHMYIKYGAKRGWQKQAAFDLGCDVKTVSRRFQRACPMVSNLVIVKAMEMFNRYDDWLELLSKG